MIEHHLQALKTKRPDLTIKAAFLGRDEATGYVGFYYFEPAKILLTLDENDILYAMKFTVQRYYKPKMLSKVSLKISGSVQKKCYITIKGADSCFDPSFVDPQDPDSNPRKSVAFGITKKDKVLLDSKYQYEECFLGQQFQSDEELIQFLGKTFPKSRRSQHPPKSGKDGKQKSGSFDF